MSLSSLASVLVASGSFSCFLALVARGSFSCFLALVARGSFSCFLGDDSLALFLGFADVGSCFGESQVAGFGFLSVFGRIRVPGFTEKFVGVLLLLVGLCVLVVGFNFV